MTLPVRVAAPPRRRWPLVSWAAATLLSSAPHRPLSLFSPLSLAFLRDLSDAGVRVALCLPSAQEHALPPSIGFLREAARHAATLAHHRNLEGLVLCDTGLLPVASAAALVVGAGAMWDPAALDEPGGARPLRAPGGCEDVNAASPAHLLATDLPAMLDGAAFGDEEVGVILPPPPSRASSYRGPLLPVPVRSRLDAAPAARGRVSHRRIPPVPSPS